MDWEDWLKDIDFSRIEGKEQKAETSGDAVRDWAHECITYWFGKVRDDRVAIPEGAEDLMVDLIKKARGERLAAPPYREVILALLCGILRNEPLDPMQSMVMAIHIGAALKGQSL